MFKLTGLLVGTLLVGGVFAQEVPAQGEAYYHFSLAKLYELREAYDQAIEEYRKALASDSRSAGIRLELARAQLQKGDAPKAIESCREAIEIDPKNADAYYLLGRIYYGSRSDPKARAQALEAFDKVLEIEPDHYHALQDAAELNFENNDYAKSAELFHRLRQVDPSAVSAYYYEAQALIELEKYQEAIDTLTAGLAVKDNIPEYLLMLGGLYQRTGQPDKAIETYRRGLAGGPEPRLNEALARALVMTGKGEEALPILERLVSMLPEDLELQFDLGKAYRQARKLQRAAEVLENLYSKDDKNLQVLYEWAGVLGAMGEREKAAEKFETLLKSTHPKAAHFRPLFLMNLAAIRQEMRQYDEAVRLLKEVLELEPEDLDAQLRLFYVYLADSRKDEALDLSARMMAAHPDEPYVLVARAQALAEANRLSEAVELIDKAIPESSNREMLYLAASQLYLNREKYGDARAAIEKGLENLPDSERLRFQLGAIYERQKDFAAAEREFRSLLGKNPEYAEVLNYLGYMLAEQGQRLEEAETHVLKAVELDPYNGAYLDSLGWVYYKLNELDKAEVNLTKAARLENSDPTIFEHLGDLYVKKGDGDQARKQYEESLRFTEKSEDAKRVRKKLNSLPKSRSRK